MSNPQVFEIAFRLGGSVDASMRRAFGQANQNMQNMDSRSKVLNGSMKVLGVAAAGVGAAFVGVATGIGKSVSAASEYHAAMKDVQMTTGASVEQMNEMKEISKNLYNKNLGEDWNDLAAAVSAAKSVTKLTGDELQNATKNALIYRDVFGEEVNESIKVTDTMMKNFGITSTQAYNLLAQGAQNGLNKSDELLDSANEYTPHFAAMGFNADEMFNIFANGLENGAFNLDKVGDAVKEFNIRSKDGSKASAEAYEIIGLNASKMTKQFAAGGPTAQKAFQQVVGAISEIKDPIQQNAAAVGLFGTMAEDLELDVIKAMANTRDQFDMTKETMESIGEIKYDSWKAAMSGIGRQIETGLMIPLGEKALPYLNKFSQAINDKMPAVTSTISNGMSKTGDVIKRAFSLLKGDGQGVRDILASLGFSDGLIQTADTIAERISVLRNTFTDAFANIAGAWQQYGPGMLSSIQEVLIYLWPKVQSAVSAVGTFLFATFQKIADFWNENGAQIVQAVSNVFNFVMKIVSFVMPAVLGIIKMIWGNIKGVINGGLNIIMGAIKIFTGLFTGDFAKMWEGVKQLFFGAVEFIWNIVQLTFYGKILGGVKSFVAVFRSFFANMWSGIVQLFKGNITSAVLTLQVYWRIMVRDVTKYFKEIWGFISGTFQAVRNIVSGGIAFVRTIFTNGLTFMSTVARTGLSTIHTRFSTIFTNIKNAVTGRFNDIVTAAKNLPKKIGDGIGSMASKVKDGTTKVINQLAKTLGKGVNGVIGGINWVLGKIGVDSTIPEWNVPAYANGTKGHPGGLAMVNDGKGSNAGRELVLTPDGRAAMFAGKDVYANLPKGTQVLSAQNTRKLLSSVPAYEDGTGVFNKIVGGVKAGWNKAKEWSGNVLDYVKDPSALLDVALNSLGIVKPSGDGMIGQMAGGAWSAVKKHAIEFVKGKLNFFSSNQNQSGIALTGGNGGGFGAPFRLTSAPGYRGDIGIRGATRQHNGWDWGAPTNTPIPATHAGLVTFAGYRGARGNMVQIKGDNGLSYIYQHNSRNAVGAGQRVNKGQVIGYVGSTGVSSGPHLHYEVLKGYAKGGRVASSQPILVGEQGPELINANAGTSILSNGKSRSLLDRILSFGQTDVSSASGGPTFHFENHVTIQGNADESDIKRALAEAEARLEQKFREMYRKYEDERRRLSFG